MAEYQLSFDGYLRLFGAMAIIACGYGYMVLSIFIKNALIHILMLLVLVGACWFQRFLFFRCIHG